MQLKNKTLNTLWLFLILSLSSAILIERIPVNDGRGWDGSLFYSIIKSWSKGELGAAIEPYRFMRMGPFVHVSLVDKIFANDNITFFFARITAVAFAFGGVFLVFLVGMKTPLAQGCQLSKIGCASLYISSSLVYAVYVMPALYPILTDHCALFLSGLSIFAAKKISHVYVKNICLLLLAVYGFFVTPLASIVPLVFVVFQSVSNLKSNLFNEYALYFSIKFKLLVFVFAFIFSGFFIILFNNHMSHMTDVFLLSRPAQSAPANISLRNYSYIFLISTIIALCSFISLFFIRALHIISGKGILLALFALTIAFVPLFLIPSWSLGMGGPPILINLLKQSLQSPLISVSAFFAYYGPVGIIGLITVSSVALSKLCLKPGDEPIFLAASLLLLPTLIGNETRQFIVLYPLLVYIALVYFKFSTLTLIVTMIFSFLNLLVGYPVSANVSKAISGKEDFLDFGWQAYFGRQGPWMSVESVVLWQSILIVFLLLLFISNNLMLKAKSNQI